MLLGKLEVVESSYAFLRDGRAIVRIEVDGSAEKGLREMREQGRSTGRCVCMDKTICPQGEVLRKNRDEARRNEIGACREMDRMARTQIETCRTDG